MDLLVLAFKRVCLVWVNVVVANIGRHDMPLYMFEIFVRFDMCMVFCRCLCSVLRRVFLLRVMHVIDSTLARRRNPRRRVCMVCTAGPLLRARCVWIGPSVPCWQLLCRRPQRRWRDGRWLVPHGERQPGLHHPGLGRCRGSRPGVRRRVGRFVSTFRELRRWSQQWPELCRALLPVLLQAPAACQTNGPARVLRTARLGASGAEVSMALLQQRQRQRQREDGRKERQRQTSA